ncbi:LacI family transcriptional regulator [Peribacillus simplex]|jgi:LacI family transcriptional regulator|uniref:LacI family transcriptional regulator n=2 Tax=Peribacillus TaxID=2675229 RepID=A0A9X9ES86_9BACI|nr:MULTISPECIES: LacI family DNA-binding transcriptional regulator [Peribacillus]PHD78877.1 LacI family transcriptional regulator [Bacillus sp. AFS043905]PRS44708.1 LacI family transcriptional regulator [Bacillus sp. RJGP41]MCT4476167.1 LacI family transcriptional regulator [Peribacillus frigoritolerans]MCY8935228.1 LacI family transcriptional regulator [Peribacillus frigoritolerans]MCY9002971.1 LacI family transcriptional regulator [Peribacillus frigoritolerans]
MKRVTTEDVAKIAGVSQSTVSRVLNDYPYIKKNTRDKVLAVINELGFTRDEIARSLVEKRTKSIGLILGSISNPFFAETAEVIIERAQELKYDVIVYNTGHKDENLEQAINLLIGKRVEGIILTSVSKNYTEKIKKLHDNGFPVLLYNSFLDIKDVNFIVMDNNKGARLAVQHLIKLGHKKIAKISGPSKYLATYERTVGYKEEMMENGYEIDEGLIFNSEFSYDKIYSFTKKLLKKKDRPTAIIAASDQMALAVLDAASSLNLKIPADLSVVGFDNIRLSANEFIGLTTISQQMDQMSLTALEKLIFLIENKETSSSSIQIFLKPELMVRKTTGPAPVQD